MDTYVEPEIEEVPGPMDEDDVMMDACGYREDISIPGILDIWEPNFYFCAIIVTVYIWYWLTWNYYPDKFRESSIEHAIENGEDVSGNMMLQGANLSRKDDDDIFPDNEPRRRHTNIFHTR